MRAARPAALALTVLAVGLLGLTLTPASAGAGGGGGGSMCDGFARGAQLEMYDSCFAGTAHLVAPETTELTVINRGHVPHTITAVDGSFDLLLETGETGTVTLPDGAVVPVYCTLHGSKDGSGMAGAIVVDPAVAVAGSAKAPASGAFAAMTPTSDREGSGVAWAVVGAAAVAGIGALGAVGLAGRRRRAIA